LGTNVAKVAATFEESCRHGGYILWIMGELSEIIGQMRRIGNDFTTVEAKSAAGGMPQSILPTMSAFANLPGGGLLILGLDEAEGFAAVGLKDAATLAAGVSSAARNAFDPPLQTSVDVESFEGNDLVVVRVHELPIAMKPCVVKRTGQAYLRYFDGDYAMSRLEMDGFIANRTRPRFDETEVEGSTRGDLDEERVDDFLATARGSDRRYARITEDVELLRKSGVLSAAGVPTVAGLLALGEHPQQFLPHCNIRAALLADGATSTTRALDSATFTGPLAAILTDTVEWVARNSRHRLIENPATGHVNEVLDPPATAVRELVSNALVHRDLSDWASSRAIELRMTGSVFRLSNPGGLYGISVSQLGVHPLTSARNRRLVEICKHLRTDDGNVVEALASGIPATLESLRSAGLPAPHFFDQGLSFTVALARGNTAAQTSLSPAGDRDKFTTAETELLDHLVGTMNVHELAAAIGATVNATQKRLTRLRTRGAITMNGGRGRESTYTRPKR
jgi:ATP-dependent DNA helicase RecG